jgi:hypothetical protein
MEHAAPAVGFRARHASRAQVGAPVDFGELADLALITPVSRTELPAGAGAPKVNE